MKKFLLLAGVACLFSTAANAGVSPYVSAKASYDFNRVKIKEAAKFEGGEVINREKVNKELFGSHVAAGVRAGYVRGEIELNNSRDIKKNSRAEDGFGKFKLYKHSVMANAYFDYLTCTPWTPYVGAGIGTSYLKAQNFFNGEKFLDKSTYNLAWQVMAGVAYEFNSHWAIDLSYRYADLGRIRKHERIPAGADAVAKVTVREHDIMLGARYTF